VITVISLLLFSVCVRMKVILKEREEKKRSQLIDDSLPLNLTSDDQVPAAPGPAGSQLQERKSCHMLLCYSVDFFHFFPVFCLHGD